MSGPAPVPLIAFPAWLGDLQVAMAGAGGGAAGDLTTLQGIANGINPTANGINCGWNIDAVLDRFTGADPGATSPAAMDGTWGEIEQRHNTTFTWGTSFQDAFAAVQAGGPGT